jgi:hypothetical protein
MTIEQAYEAAYRFVWQYLEREVASEPLALMLVSVEPTTDDARTSDPASWSDWEQCVAETLRGEPLPRFPSVSHGEDRGQPGDAAGRPTTLSSAADSARRLIASSLDTA